MFPFFLMEALMVVDRDCRKKKKTLLSNNVDTQQKGMTYCWRKLASLVLVRRLRFKTFCQILAVVIAALHFLVIAEYNPMNWAQDCEETNDYMNVLSVYQFEQLFVKASNFTLTANLVALLLIKRRTYGITW